MVIFFILTLSLILRLINLNQSLWLDEAINVLATKNYSLFGMISEYAIADFHPPGYFVILWVWAKIFGTQEISVRIPSVILGVSTVMIIYLIGKKLHSKNVGIISALLLAINPLHIYYSQEARMYALAAFAAALNLFLFIKLLKKEKLNIFFLIVGNLLVLGSDYLTYFIFPAQLIFLLFFHKFEHIKKWALALSAAILLGFWWMPTFLNQLNSGVVVSSKLPAWRLIVGGFDFKTIPLTFVKFIIGRISYPDKGIYVMLLLIPVTVFLFLLIRGMQVTDKFNKYLLLIWLITPVLLASVFSVFVPVYSYFRLLFILPIFLILISFGISSLKSKIKFAFLVAVIFIELVSAFIYLLNPAYQREDWRGLVSYLKGQPEAIVLFESSGTLPPFDYYTKNNLQAFGALKDFPAKGDNDVANLPENEKNIYLVDYLVGISDSNRLVAKRLGQLGYQQLDIKNFNGVGFVYHYVKE